MEIQQAATSREKTDMLADGVVSIDEAVEFTRLSRGELYRRMSAGDLPFVKRGKRRLIPRRALVQFLAEGLC